MESIQIAIGDARPGMVLAADVPFQGTTLLNKDMLLDDALIMLMRNCEVAILTVVDDHAGAAHSGANIGEKAPAPSFSGRTPGTPPPSEIKPHDPNDHAASTAASTAHPSAGPPISPQHPAAPALSQPRITVTVSPDKMTARLVVEPIDGNPAELDRAMFADALAERGVIFGVDDAALAVIIDKWRHLKRRYECSPAARGTPAAPGEEGAWHITLRHVCRRDDVDVIRNCRRFAEAAAKLPPIDRAITGGVIAAKQMERPSAPGKNVCGLPVFTDEIIRHELILETNVTMSPDNRTILSEADGIAYLVDGAIGVVPIDFDGQIEISIAPDRMSAFCTILPPGPGGTLPGKEDVRRLLSEKGACSGILDADIDTFLTLCSRGAYPSDPFVVARGTPPEKGADGSCLYHFSTQTSLTPAIGDDGHADYKSMNIVNSVVAGQELVSLAPPGPGSDGCDILGQRLIPEPGVPVKLPQGANTVPDAQNPGILRAATDGIVRCTGGLVEVSEGYVVPADVNFSIGNITYAKTVIVSGDVKAGFDVHCGGDLQVSGTIEDCRIVVGGNVLCKLGFVGQGKGVIEAKGDVNIGFMKNQTVRCFKNATIAKEALNSTILSRGAVLVHGNPLSVAGGTICARLSITVNSVGNHTGIRTLLEAGTDFLVADELVMIEEQHKSALALCRELTDSLLRFQKMLQGRKQLSTTEQKKLSDLVTAIRQAKQQQAVLDERKAIVTAKQYHLAEAFIKIEHAAYAGTLLKFGDRHHMIKEELAGPKRFRYIDHEIIAM